MRYFLDIRVQVDDTTCMDTQTQDQTIEDLYTASRAAYAAGDEAEADRLWDEAQTLRMGPPMTDEELRDAARTLRATHDPDLEARQAAEYEPPTVA